MNLKLREFAMEEELFFDSHSTLDGYEIISDRCLDVPTWEEVYGGNEFGADSPVYVKLQPGDSGEIVKFYQQLLVDFGYDIGPDGVDGQYGSDTESAVIDLQVDYATEVDGTINAETTSIFEQLATGQLSRNTVQLELHCCSLGCMPRAGQLKSESPRRLSDVVSVGVVTRVFPSDLVDEVVAECGRTEQRHRSLPARTMAHFAIGLALHADGSYQDVMGLMTDGLSWAQGDDGPVRLPSKSAISQARERLGSEPMRVLFERVAAPLATPGTSGCWLAGRRMVAIDGMTLDVSDSEVNDAEFGRPGVNKGEKSAFPQARVVAVAECGTRAIFDAVVGPYTTGENTLAVELVKRLKPGMVLLADRGFCGYPLWHIAQATGADLLWRAKSNTKPRHVETLDDGTWIGEIRPGGNAGRTAEPHQVRVIDYAIDDGRTNDSTYRLFTTILDPSDASAVDLAAAYAQRWEIETAFDELKTHQRGPRIVLRSKLADLVYQEIWGYLCCHYAIRTLMFEAADHAKVDTDRVSFVAALRFARRSIAQARDFSPSRP